MDISLKGISKSFGQKQVIKPLDLTIESGSFTTLLGPSGCGKTTLLRMIAGLETPDVGEIAFGSETVFSKARNIDMPPEDRRAGFVFQDFALWPHMTVFENVAFGLRARKDTDRLDTRVKTALDAVQLGDYLKRYPNQLSGGQQQRVAFARAIVVEPQLILFDEPLSALDAILREQLRAELKSLVAQMGITSVFVTHDQMEAMSMSTKIAVMDEGRVHQYAAPETIYHEPADRFVADFVGKSNWLSKQEMVRPEAVSFEASPESIRYDMSVAAVHYLGNGYEIQLMGGEEQWSLFHRLPLEVGQTVPVFVEANSIRRFADSV